MAPIFITGSSDGIGLETARQLISAGRRVTVHARSAERAGYLADQVDEAHGIAIGDLSVLSGIRQVAEEAAKLGPYDPVIHNAGAGGGAGRGGNLQIGPA
jgi:NAD(P)-dependent dehydrogenase (short-subunit alcohol dehydrogenase family)